MSVDAMLNNAMNELDNFERQSRLAGNSSGIGLKANVGAGNRPFRAQVDLNVRLVYSHYDGDVWTLPTPDQLPTNLKNKIPVWLFGYADFYGGYQLANSKFPAVGGWNIIDIVTVNASTEIYNQIYGGGAIQLPSQAVKNGLANRGDIIICLGTSGDQPYICEIVISCKQVTYGSLLNSVASDVFLIAGLRYSIPDDTKVAQFNNELKIVSQSIFGKDTSDTINPLAYRQTTQFLKNQIDVDIEIGIDKTKEILMYQNYDCLETQFSIFIPSTDVKKA